MRELVKIFKALSDETRLRILNLLLERECCVCEVMQALDISQTRASRNLSILYDAGFLVLKKEGLWSLYSIDRERMPVFFGYTSHILLDGFTLEGINFIYPIKQLRLQGFVETGKKQERLLFYGIVVLDLLLFYRVFFGV